MKRLLLTAALAAGLALVARPARACGGFFCSNTPVNQSGERIVFAVTDTHVQAHVQIQYAGDARKFAWVVPLHARPTVSIGSAALFNFVDQRTTPVFQLDWSGAGQCGYFYPALEDAAAGGGPPNANGGGVTVVSQESVGPYDAAILTATDANALKAWLRDNQYDLTPEGEDALVPYVSDGFYFVALKLQQNKSTGDLRPIVLDMDSNQPCIPIRLTAIAAQPDMPITAFVFAPGRAVPTNFRHVLINESRIDWLNFGSNYRTVASAAVDEAGGHAFLTEYAGPTTRALSAKLDDGRLDTAKLAGLADPVDFVEELIAQNFPRDGLLAMLEHYVPEPASLKSQNVTEQQFYNQIAQYRQQIANDPDRAPFDAAAFAHDLDETVVQPLKKAQAMIDANPYLTRLFTTMSPAEMTVDPEFAFNTSLPDVANLHTAKLECDGTNSDTARVTLADGRTFEIKRDQGPLTTGPAAARIEQLAGMGPPSVITDNTQVIDDTLDGTRPTGCGCGAVDPSVAMLALGGLALLRRRRA